MKTAVTADLHLAARDQYPERYSALENILAQLNKQGITQLIIAGDLFDESYQNYSEFENICKKHPKTIFYLIPGNHDEDISKKKIAGDNITIYEEPAIINLDQDSVPILVIPYRGRTDMGSEIAKKQEQLPAGRWILVSHGDYHEGITQVNPLEPNVYMPLARSDVEHFKPAKVLLGHIHKPFNGSKVCYVGSPCGLDISETGPRHFMVLDAAALTLAPQEVDTDKIYFDETFVVIPSGDELDRLKKQIADRIASWHLRPDQNNKVRVRVKVTGFSSDRQALQNTLAGAFVGYHIENEFDLSRLLYSVDEQLKKIAEDASARLAATAFPGHPNEPGKDEILEAILTTIYLEQKK